MGCRGKGVSEKLGWAWEEREWENAKSAILNKHVRSKLLNCGGRGVVGVGVCTCVRACASVHTCVHVEGGVCIHVRVCM